MKIKQYLTIIIVIFGLLGGIVAGIWLSGNRQFFSSLNAEPLKNLAKAAQGADSPQTNGSESAIVTIEEFADFQCPPCAMLHNEMKNFKAEYGSKLRVIHRHFPLEMHKHAFEAAQAAEAAALQGKFWEMSDLLYERQDEWGETANARQAFIEFAKKLNLNLEMFNHDMDAPETKARIKADKERGDSINIAATPTVFINGVEVGSDSMNIEGIKGLIDKAIQ